MAKTNGVVTKAYLDKKLKNFVTKNYLDRRLTRERVFLDQKLIELKDEFKNEVVGFKDEVVGEIKKLREDDAAHQYSHARINDELQLHAKQIARLQTA